MRRGHTPPHDTHAPVPKPEFNVVWALCMRLTCGLSRKLSGEILLVGLSSGWLQEGLLGIVVSTGDLIGETHLKLLILHAHASKLS